MRNATAAIRDVALRGDPEPAGELARDVFERFPYGLLVVDADRRLVASNGKSRELLGRPDAAPEAPVLCCELLGCRAPGTALEGLCLTERALADGQPLPDVRVDVPGSGATLAVWVSTAPIDDGRVLMQLRRGSAQDRRRRTEPHWVSGPSLRIVTLGRTQVISPEGPLDGAWLRQRPGQLLKLLVCNRHRVIHTDEIAITFWPENERTALQNVRYFVHGLRGQLEPDRPPRSRSSFVLAHEGGYGLNLARISVDADEFEQLAAEGLRLHVHGEHGGARVTLERAAALYGGDFLADEPYAEWALEARALLHEQACRVFSALADIALIEGAIDTGIAHLSRHARMEPLDADVQQRLLRLLLSRGRSSEAQRHLRQVQAAWLGAFGEKPEFDLVSLRRESRLAA